MSTRSRIGMVNPKNGKVISIYCHWDGYVENNGAILVEHYTDPQKVEELISLGDISILDKDVAPKQELAPSRYAPLFSKSRKRPMVKHTFDTPQEGVVVAYGRDRGEDPNIIKPRIDKSVRAYVNSDIEEYGYLFKDGEWYVVKAYTDDGKRKLELVKDVLANLAAKAKLAS